MHPATRLLIFLTVVGAAVGLAPASVAVADGTPDHIVVGENEDGQHPLKLFTAGDLPGGGHGPSAPPGAIFPIVRIPVGSVYAQPRYGGYMFSTTGYADLGFDYANVNSSHALLLSKLPGSPTNFYVATKRLAYSRPADFAIYNEFGTPKMVEDEQEYAFGTASGGHVHPLVFIRRPGLVRWDVQFTSDQWLPSDPYTYYFTSVPGRATLVPIDMSGVFNADLVDSDAADAPVSFDGAGRYWLLNGLYGTAAGLPVDGMLGGFRLGGPNAAGLLGGNANALFDDGPRSLAATVDLQAVGQAGSYLGVEFIIAGAGAFTTSDVIEVTFRYGDNTTTGPVQIKRGGASWLPYRPLDDWQQTATPRPWLAVGRSGDRAVGFIRSTGAGVDLTAGENTFFFRAMTTVNDAKVLKEIVFADYTGSNRVGVFAILAVKKAPLTITTTAMPDAAEGAAYSFALSADGTPPFKNWAAAGLPAGLGIDPATGVVSGTPQTGASGGSPYTVAFYVEDSINDYDANYPPESDTTELTLVVRPRPGDINGDGLVNLDDVPPFVEALVRPESADPLHVARSDLNDDGTADGADIAPFIIALTLP